jgi:hypothetical protein
MATGATSLREYAIELGVVYRRLHQLGYLPLDTWAVPAPRAPIGAKLFEGLNGVYWWQGREYRDEYWHAYQAVMPALEREANAAAQAILAAERKSLQHLLRRLRLPGTADRMHEVAQRIGRRAGGYGASRDEVKQAGAETGGVPLGWRPEDPHIRAFGKALRAKIHARVAAAVRAEVAELTAERPALDPREMAAAESRKSLAEMVVVLFNHPREIEILTAYDRSPVAGLELASELIGEAADAIDEFAGDLREDPEDVWRFAPLVHAGITRLGLSDVKGFPEYAVDAGQVLGRSAAETVVTHLGLVLFCVGIVFTGPVGAVVVGVADLALTGAGGVLAYLRERQQDMAASASAFRAAGAKIADPSDYEDTKMAAAAALVSALSLLGPGKQLLKAKSRKPGTLPPGQTGPVLDPGDHSAGFFPKSKLETAVQKSGDTALLTKKEILENARATSQSERIGRQSDQLTPQKLAANKKRLSAADAARLGPGAPRELAPEALDAARGTPARTGAPQPGFDPLDYNVVPEDKLARDAAAGSAAGSRTGKADLLDKATMTARQQQAAKPDLGSMPRANEPGKAPRRVISQEESVHGINLEWERTIRKRTPSPEIQEWARRRLSPGDVDPLIPTLRVDAAVADHVVPVELIKQFPGFAQLDLEAQIRILNTPENFMAVSKRVNEARGSMPFSKWAGLPGHPIPADIAAVMQRREKELAALLQQRIDDALRAQQQTRGLR